MMEPSIEELQLDLLNQIYGLPLEKLKLVAERFRVTSPDEDSCLKTAQAIVSTLKEEQKEDCDRACPGHTT